MLFVWHTASAEKKLYTTRCVPSCFFHISEEAKGMEGNVNTGPTGADSSTSCDASSISTSHSSTSAGDNNKHVSPPVSDIATAASGQHNSTRTPQDDDDDNRDFGEELRPLRLPSAPVDHARLPSESFSNSTNAVLPCLSVHNVATLWESPRERSSIDRRQNVVHHSNHESLHLGDTLPHANGIASCGDAAVRRPSGATKNTSRINREVLSHQETARSSDSSNSSHVERMENGSDFLPGREAAADESCSDDDVTVVSADSECQFLDADDGGSGGTVITTAVAAAAVQEDTADQLQEAVGWQGDVCENSQAPQRQQEEQPLPQPEQQQSLRQQEQHPQQQEEWQQSQPPQQEQQEQQPQQQSVEHHQQEQLLQRGEQQAPERDYPSQEAHLRQGHHQQNEQQEAEPLAGEDSQITRVSGDEERAQGTRGVSGGNSGAARRESVSSAEASATQTPSRDLPEDTEQHGESAEGDEDGEPEGGESVRSEENCSSEEGDADEDKDDDTQSSYGCQHYRRRCKVVAPCCGEAFWCRHCHNDVKCEQEKEFKKAHEIDRTAVTEVICAVCDTRQGVSNQCINCKVEFGKYYCEKCKFWDDKGIKKKVYHCDLCGLCRTGGAESFFHCTTCGSCYSTDIRGSHKCVEKAMHQPCPICCENMFTSIRQVHVLKCGHTLHAVCNDRNKFFP